MKEISNAYTRFIQIRAKKKSKKRRVINTEKNTQNYTEKITKNTQEIQKYK
jgi:hypothetical protein